MDWLDEEITFYLSLFMIPNFLFQSMAYTSRHLQLNVTPMLVPNALSKVHPVHLLLFTTVPTLEVFNLSQCLQPAGYGGGPPLQLLGLRTNILLTQNYGANRSVWIRLQHPYPLLMNAGVEEPQQHFQLPPTLIIFFNTSILRGVY